MPRDSEKTRLRILDAAYELFFRHGFNRVGVEQVAASAGITKRTLYAHFESKDRLLEGVLELQLAMAVSRSKRWADLRTDNLEAAIDQLFGDLARWSKSASWTGAGFTRLAIELADMPGHPARSMAHLHKKAVEESLADLLKHYGRPDAEARARELAILLEGAIVLILVHGDAGYADQAADAGKRLLLK